MTDERFTIGKSYNLRKIKSSLDEIPKMPPYKIAYDIEYLETSFNMIENRINWNLTLLKKIEQNESEVNWSFYNENRLFFEETSIVSRESFVKSFNIELENYKTLMQFYCDKVKIFPKAE